MDKEKLISLFLRLGIAITFLYAAIASFINPSVWASFFPLWMKNIVQENVLLTIFSVYEIILALWLILNRKIFYAAILTALTMVGIIVFNFGAFDITFRDISILFSSVALAVLDYDKQ